MKTVAIIQARLSSSRLPGKVLKVLKGRPMLGWVVDRVRRANGIEVLVATSKDATDDPLAAWCQNQGIPVVRGPLHDVLGRYYQAASHVGADVVIRITSDCPFVDWTIIQQAVRRLHEGSFAYVGNSLKRTYPHGADVEVFTMDALRTAHEEARDAFEREHVTPFIWSRPDRFRQEQILAPDHMFYPELRITVDTDEDFMLAQAIYDELGDSLFKIDDVIRLVQLKPWLPYINMCVRQKQVFADPDPKVRMAKELLEAARLALGQDLFRPAAFLAEIAGHAADGTVQLPEADRNSAADIVKTAAERVSYRL